MSRSFLQLLAVLLALLSTNSVALENGNDPSLKDAISILTSTKPLLYPSIEMQVSDTSLASKARKLYNLQISAINVLREAKAAGTEKFLIPYLNYPVPSLNPLYDNLIQYGQNIDSAKSKWPVFAALIEMPESSKALKSYCLATSNPLRFRVCCFLVLRYVDPKVFKEVASTFDVEFADSNSKLKAYLQEIESGKAVFVGVVPVEVYTQ